MKPIKPYPQSQPTLIGSKGRPATLLNFWIAYGFTVLTGRSPRRRGQAEKLRRVAYRGYLPASELFDTIEIAAWVWFRIMAFALAAGFLVGFIGLAGPAPVHSYLGAVVLALFVIAGLAIPEMWLLFARFWYFARSVRDRGAGRVVDLRSPGRWEPHGYDFWIAAATGAVAMALVNLPAPGLLR